MTSKPMVMLERIEKSKQEAAAKVRDDVEKWLAKGNEITVYDSCAFTHKDVYYSMGKGKAYERTTKKGKGAGQ